MENFEIKITADGSPTLILGEPMHNLKGALSEVLYVYDEALGLALFRLGPALKKLRVASVGLGLGYNEWMTVAHFLREGVSFDQLEVCSWEINPNLKAQFLEKATSGFGPSEKRGVYLSQLLMSSGCSQSTETENSPSRAGDDFSNKGIDVATLVARSFGIDERLLKTKMAELLVQQKIVLRSDVRGDTGARIEKAANIVYFDAFSSYTNPELWDEVFLKNFIDCFCDSTFCVFASYASTSRLKNALTVAGFELIKRKGFSGKRECTLGVRS